MNEPVFNRPDLVSCDAYSKLSMTACSGARWYGLEMPLTRQEVETILDLCNRTLTAFPSDSEFKIWARSEGDIRSKPLSKSQSSYRGFVYLMRDNRSGLHKIGFSTKPSAREQTLLGQCPDIELIWTKPAQWREETLMHHKYQHLRVRGEWFKLGEPELKEIQV